MSSTARVSFTALKWESATVTEQSLITLTLGWTTFLTNSWNEFCENSTYGSFAYTRSRTDGPMWALLFVFNLWGTRRAQKSTKSHFLSMLVIQRVLHSICKMRSLHYRGSRLWINGTSVFAWWQFSAETDLDK